MRAQFDHRLPLAGNLSRGVELWFNPDPSQQLYNTKLTTIQKLR
jgi:hypothetical protein